MKSTRIRVLTRLTKPHGMDAAFSESRVAMISHSTAALCFGLRRAPARRWGRRPPNGFAERKQRHSALKFVTPLERHTGADLEILANRDVLYRASKEKHPERWSGKTRNWERSKSVTLNPDKPAPAPAENLQEAA